MQTRAADNGVYRFVNHDRAKTYSDSLKLPKIHPGIIVTQGPLRILVAHHSWDRDAAWALEVLRHWGLIADYATQVTSESLQSADVLISFGPVNIDEVELARWVEQGGQWVASGRTDGHEALLGIMPFDHLTIGRDRLRPVAKRAEFWPPEAGAFRVFGGRMVKPRDCEIWAELESGYVGLSRSAHGSGAAWFFAPHLGRNFATMAMGRSVESDGIGPNDGSALLADGVCRAEDGTVLSFEEDRVEGEGTAPAFFGLPHADLLAEVFLSVLGVIAASLEKSWLLAWPWPRNASAVGILAVECDDFDGESVFTVKQQMDVSGVPGTWFVPPPGYALDIYRMIRRWDDEVGLMYDPPSHTEWNEGSMRSQYLLINRTSGSARLESVKTIDGRWRGYDSFYRNCVGAGLRVSLSKGGRQPGTQGFLFGTCHPFYPHNDQGESSMTLEIPSLILRPSELAPTSSLHAIFRQVALRNGCVTVSVPSNAANTDQGRIGLKQTFLLANQYRIEWTRPHRLHHFEKARRALQWKLGANGEVEVRSEIPMAGLTVLATGGLDILQVDGKVPNAQAANRFGTKFQAVVLDLEGRQSRTIQVGNRTSDTQAA